LRGEGIQEEEEWKRDRKRTAWLVKGEGWEWCGK
jgi:hypothetical protein